MSQKLPYAILYAVGVVMTLIAAGVAIWPDLEAQNFSQTFTGKDRTRLSCPIVMHSAETAAASIKLHNPLQRRARFSAISFITANNQATIPAEERQAIYIEPNSSETLNWAIDDTNSVYGYMILARVYVFRSTSVPSQSGSCGVWLLTGGWADGVSVSGQTLYWLWSALGIAALFAGGLGASGGANRLSLVDKRTDKPRFGVLFSVVVLLAFGFGVWGVPLAGIGMLLLLVLIFVSLFEGQSRLTG